jgi:hypothetical protein
MDVTHDWPLERLSTLRELQIEGEDSVIPNGTWKLPELTCLMLECAWAEMPLPDNIPVTAKLRTFVFSSADWCAWPPPVYPLPDNLYGLRELRHLVYDGHIESIPDGFSQLADLTSLELTAVGSAGGVLLAHLGRLTNLQSFILERGSGDLDVSILGSLLSLQKLELQSVDLGSLDFSQLTRLTTRTISECSGGLPPSIGQLCSLQSLQLTTFLHPPQMPHILGATLPRLAARKDL